MKNLAIVILNYNTYEMTLDLVNSLGRICPKDSCSIIVVDNASPNESAQILQENALKTNLFTFIKSEKNGGYAAGNNIGLRFAYEKGYKYSLVLNNDIIIEDWATIEKMIGLMDANESIGAVSPVIKSPVGRISPPKYPLKPSFVDLTFGVLNYDRKRYRNFDEYRNARVYAPRGSCMLLSNKALAKIDFLDESTFLYYEEPILAEKLLKLGLECWHCGLSTVVHNHSATINSFVKKRTIAKILCESYRYYLKTYREFNFIQIFLCLIVRKLAVMRG